MFKKIRRRLHDGSLNELIKETRWIYRYAKKYKKAVFIYILIGLVTTCLSLGTAVIFKYLVNYLVQRTSGNIFFNAEIFFVGTFYVLLNLSNILFGALCKRYSVKVNVRINNEIRSDVFGHFMNIEWESLQQYHSGDLLNRINSDVNTVAGTVLGWFPNLIIKSAQFIFAFIIIVCNDWTTALFALIGAPATIIVSRLFLGKMRKYNKQMREVNSNLTSFTEESLQNMQSVKAFNLVDSFRTKLNQIQKIYYDTSVAYNRISVVSSTAISITSLFVSVLCLAWGSFRVWTMAISLGTMVLFIQLAGYLTSAISGLINLVPSAIESTVAAQRIMTILELPSEDTGERDRAEALKKSGSPISILLENLDASYLRGEPVLNSVTLKIVPGEMIAIVGPSGSGKTTLFRLLLGLLPPKEGTAKLFAKNGDAMEISPSTRCLFSYVPQDSVIFSGTVADTLRLSCPDASDDELWEALSAACADGFVRSMPEGIHTHIGERGSGLSGGQNQRLAIARALLSDAPILLLDEVTSALDLETEDRVLENILSYRGEKTCVVATHRPSVLKNCKRIYKIVDGKLSDVTSQYRQ